VIRKLARSAPVLVFVFGLAFRFAIISQYRSTSPDGDQYYTLEQSLTAAHTLAYRDGAPTYTRLPGYPLFLALTALGHPTAREADLTRAAICNVLLDAGTALLVFAIVLELLRSHRRARLWATVAMASVFACPILFLFASYRLTESLATLLCTLEIFFAMRALREQLWRWAICAGLAAGVGQLVRVDLITVAPSVALAIYFSAEPLRRRVLALALAAATACVAIAPWALRNLHRFDTLHVTAAEWPAQDGRELPTGMIAWMRTWSTGAAGEAEMAGAVVFGRNLELKMVRRAMFDSAAERTRLEALLARYNTEWLSPAVDGEFRALAADRFHAAPLRWLVTLPARRFLELYRAPRHVEFPLRVGFLGLPRLRPVFDVWNVVMYLGALAGAIALWRMGQRKLLAVLGAAIVARTLLHLWAVPPFVSQRYLVEVVPLFLALGACAPAIRTGRGS
jgi:hypothetical protein